MVYPEEHEHSFENLADQLFGGLQLHFIPPSTRMFYVVADILSLGFRAVGVLTYIL